MKNYFHLLYIFSLSLILSGCFFSKKQTPKKESFVEILSPTEIVSIEDEEEPLFTTGDNFLENEEEISGKSIFEEEDESEEDDQELILVNNPIDSSKNKIDPLMESNGTKILISNNEVLTKVGTIYFDFNKNNIKPNQIDLLSSIIKNLKEKINTAEKVGCNWEIVIKGHACNFARSRRYNLQLSDKRAKNVKLFLIKNGISEYEISSFGCGTEELIIKDGNIEEQSPNRRAEIFFINKK